MTRSLLTIQSICQVSCSQNISVVFRRRLETFKGRVMDFDSQYFPHLNLFLFRPDSSWRCVLLQLNLKGQFTALAMYDKLTDIYYTSTLSKA